MTGKPRAGSYLENPVSLETTCVTKNLEEQHSEEGSEGAKGKDGYLRYGKRHFSKFQYKNVQFIF